MSKSILRSLFVLLTEEGLQRNPAGAAGPWMPTLCPCWAICYTQTWDGNPFHRDERVLDMLKRVGDRCANRPFDSFGQNTWLDAVLRIKDDLESERLSRWLESMRRHAQDYCDEWCTDLSKFDGNVPNSVTWTYVYLHRVGTAVGDADLVATADLAMERQIGSQTPDGCFREFQSAAVVPGSHVTMYNRVTATAVNLYYHDTGCPAAAEALEKAWRWFYDFRLPDFSAPPTLDHRATYRRAPNLAIPAWFVNKPEGRHIAAQCWRRIRDDFAHDFPGAYFLPEFGIFATVFDMIDEQTPERKPEWPEFRRMVAGEAGIRRRHGWAAVLSGLTNLDQRNMGVRVFSNDRQDCLNLFHERLGLIIGSSHSKLDPDFSSFVFFENDAAYYLPNHAHLKSTPPLDTLLLRYGANIGALSVDTTDAACARITFSIHGELGERPDPGPGHPITAAAARVHMLLRLKDGDRVALPGRDAVTLGDDHIIVRCEPGECVQFDGWSLSSPDVPWEFRWPTWGVDPYSTLNPDPREKLALVEAVLMASPEPRPTGTFEVRLDP